MVIFHIKVSPKGGWDILRIPLTVFDIDLSVCLLVSCSPALTIEMEWVYSLPLTMNARCLLYTGICNSVSGLDPTGWKVRGEVLQESSPSAVRGSSPAHLKT